MPGRNGLGPDAAQWLGNGAQRPCVRDATRLTPDTAKQADGSARDDNGRGSPVRPPGKKSASSPYGQIVSDGSLAACLGGTGLS